jgi:PAS domain S-box-containing protein
MDEKAPEVVAQICETLIREMLQARNRNALLEAGQALVLVRQAGPPALVAPLPVASFLEQPRPVPVAPPPAAPLAPQPLPAPASSEQRYRQLFESMIEGAALYEIICDATGKAVDYRYLALNPAFERLTGLKAREVVGRTAREVTPDTEPRWLEQFATVAQTQSTTHFETLVEELQRYLHIEAFCPAPGQCAVLLEDITENKRLEEQRRSGEEKFRKLTALAPIGVCLTGPHHLCQYVNEKWSQMSGYSFSEMLGDKWIKAVHPEDRERVSINWDAAVVARDTWKMEYRLQATDGSVTWVYGLATPLLDPQGNLTGYIGTHLDVTERKRNENERSELDAKLQQTQKLESLGVLAGGIAHDFNNILMTILGNVDLVLQDLPPNASARTYLSDAEKAARRAAELCRQMLAYSGKGHFVVESVNLNEVINDMARMLEISISKKAVLRYNLAPTLPAVEADVSQLQQILMNLVINASEAIGERSGIISLNTSASECDRAYLSNTWLKQDLPEGTYVCLEISDSGCGMKPDVLERIFDPFFTTKFTGRGLGLAAVLGIVRGHKGSLKVYSELGRGTTFKILLPASPKAAVKLEIAPPQRKLWRGSGTVLLADDEESVRLLGAQMVERLGFRCLTASDGYEVLRIFRERGNEVSVVLLDLTMPHLDGEQTFEELRHIKPDIRVIMSSGYNQQDVAQRFVGKKLAGFIQKPYKLTALSEVLRLALEGNVANIATA